MKKFKIFILTTILLCCLSALVALTACSSEVDTPTNVAIDSDTLVLSWDSVDDADSYTISINGELNYSLANSYDLTYLAEGDYTIRVKANIASYESGWSSQISFTREHETGLIFDLINDNAEYTVSSIGTATGSIIVPATYRGKPVTAISDNAFKNKTRITSLVLPESITSIGSAAFSGCSYLASVATAVGYTEDGDPITESGFPDGLTYIGSNAFYSCVNLVFDFVVPENITEISDYAFYNCQSMTSLTIGDHVTSIGTYAFWNCVALTEITIPDSVTTIDDKAFNSCKGVTKLVLGDGLVTLGTYVFKDCTSLYDITIGSGLSYLNTGTFHSCSSELLTSMHLPDNIISIGAYCFYNCTNLSDFTISDDVVYVGQYAFKDTAAYNAAKEAGELFYVSNWLIDGVNYMKQDNLTSTSLVDTDFKDGLLGVASYAFLECDVITAITLPDTVKYIGFGAFYNCESLITVIIGSGTVEIGESAFRECSALKYVYLGSLDNSHIKESSLVTIERYAFAQCLALSEIEIPASVTTIGAFAFYGTIIWPEGGTDAAYYAGTVTRTTGNKVNTYGNLWLIGAGFTGSLTPVIITSGTVGICEYAFAISSSAEDGLGVTSVTIPDTVKYIGDAAFYDCYVLQSVTFPEGITEIGNFMFFQCYNLYQITIPDTVTTIGTAAFAYCYCLGYYNEDSTIIIPASVTSIGDYAFYRCGYYEEEYEVDDSGEIVYDADGNPIVTGINIYSATNIVIEGDNVVIGEKAFAYFITLKSIDMGDGVTELGDCAFFGCTYLESVKLSSSLTEIKDRTFYMCSSLTSITIPDSVTSIGDKAFYKNYALTNVTLGSGVKSIGNYAFYYCTSLQYINFPSSLESIGTQAFRSCIALNGVALTSNIKEVGEHAFYGCYYLTIYMENGVDTSEWNENWNSSYRPIAYGYTISSSGYVTSITVSEELFSNIYAGNSMSDPVRDGYTFVGWSTRAGASTAEYTWDDLSGLEEGTTLYAVWVAD